MHGVARIAAVALAATLLICAPAQAQQATLSIGDAPNVIEGNSGTTNAVFRVTRSGDTSMAVHFNYGTCCTVDAEEGVDHDVAFGNNIQINAGATFIDITVPVSGDTAVETDGTFGVQISSSDAAVGRSIGYARIVDDDGRPPGTTISVSDAGNRTEGGGNPATFTVTVSNDDATVPMSIDYDHVRRQRQGRQRLPEHERHADVRAARADEDGRGGDPRR